MRTSQGQALGDIGSGDPLPHFKAKNETKNFCQITLNFWPKTKLLYVISDKQIETAKTNKCIKWTYSGVYIL